MQNCSAIPIHRAGHGWGGNEATSFLKLHKQLPGTTADGTTTATTKSKTRFVYPQAVLCFPVADVGVQ